MEYVFDIKRTSREALDHARRSLYKPEEENCGQCDKERMDVSENANCDIEESQAKKCQVRRNASCYGNCSIVAL